MRRTLLLLLACAASVFAQPATTTVSDTFYAAIGGPTFCYGTFTLSWTTFYSEDGFLIQAGTSAPVTVSAMGTFSVAVVPTNVNIVPATGIYSVRYNLQPAGCAPQSEYWSVPVGGGPVNLNAVRTLPQPPPSLIPIASLYPATASGTYQLCSINFVIQWGSCAGGASGITGSGTAGKLAKFTAATVIANAAVGDITDNFTGCSLGTQYLGFDGACHTLISQLTYSAIVGLWTGGGCTGSNLLGADGACHAAGSGTVTTFSAGNASPFFTTTVANPTTAPALSFTVTTQSANLVLAGPVTGSAAAPTFRSLIGTDLPTPTTSTLGAVESTTAVTHQFLTALANSGIFSQAQPAFTDLSGSATCGQLPALTGDTTTSAGSCATTTAKINGTAFPASTHGIKSNSSSQPVAQTATDIVAEFTGCSLGTQYLGADGACHAAGGLSVSGFYLYDGANYYIGAGLNVATLPSASSFSWLTTQGTASAGTVRNALDFTAPSTTGDVARCYGNPISSNTTLTVALSFENLPTNFAYTGIGFFESSSGKLVTYGVYNITQVPSSSNPLQGQLAVLPWTNSTSPTSFVYTSPSFSFNGDFRWYQIVYAAGSPGTVSFNYSTDGQVFHTVYSENANSHFTTAPDNWCVFTDPNNSGGTYTEDTMVYSWNAHP
jgi:hypothetical protein